MTARDAAIGAFLAAQGWAGACRAPLAGDASARRYERLRAAGRGAILMDMPPASGLDPRPFLAVTAWLRQGGCSAPEILGADPDRGLVLLEDLGDDLFARLCAGDPAREPELYAAAVDLLAELQRRPPPGADKGADGGADMGADGGADGGAARLGNGGWSPPPYDLTVLMREARLVVEWYLPAATGRPVPAGLAAEYAALTEAAFAQVPAAPPVAVLRDYHAENLIWLPGRAGRARVGMLDYQDMLTGHPAYDLVSLLEDARRDTGEALRAALLARYLGASGADAEAFGHAANVLAAQRNLKIVGLFTRLARRDGKPRYLGHLPRVWANLQRDLGHPALAPLQAWVARHLPPPDPAVLTRIEAGP